VKTAQLIDFAHLAKDYCSSEGMKQFCGYRCMVGEQVFVLDTKFCS